MFLYANSPQDPLNEYRLSHLEGAGQISSLPLQPIWKALKGLFLMKKCSQGLDKLVGRHSRKRELTQEHQHANTTNKGSDPVVEPKTSLAWERRQLLHRAKCQTQDLKVS